MQRETIGLREAVKNAFDNLTESTIEELLLISSSPFDVLYAHEGIALTVLDVDGVRYVSVGYEGDTEVVRKGTCEELRRDHFRSLAECVATEIEAALGDKKS
jgi:hypothetical protein